MLASRGKANSEASNGAAWRQARRPASLAGRRGACTLRPAPAARAGGLEAQGARLEPVALCRVCWTRAEPEVRGKKNNNEVRYLSQALVVGTHVL